MVLLRQETNMDQFDLKMKKKADKDITDNTIQKISIKLGIVESVSG